MYIKVCTLIYLHVRSQKVSTTFHFESGLIRLATPASSLLDCQTTQAEAGLAAPKLPQPGNWPRTQCCPAFRLQQQTEQSQRNHTESQGWTSGCWTESRRAASHYAPRKPAIWTVFSLVLQHSMLYTGINSAGASIFLLYHAIQWYLVGTSISLYWEGTCILALPNAFHACGHLWIYNLKELMLWDI